MLISEPKERTLRSFRLTLLIATSCLAASSLGLASPITCPEVGVQDQKVLLTYGGTFIESWDVTGTEPYEIKLPTEFRLGVAISPAPREIYLRAGEWAGEIMQELVTIQLYDMGSSPPSLLHHNYGGSNSVQGFGLKGGADTAQELGPEDVELFLQRPVCVRVADIPSGEIAGAE